MRTSTKTRRLPGITTIRPQARVSSLIDSSVAAPRSAMDNETAIRQMASDMREVSQRDGGIDEAGLMLLGFTRDQVATLAPQARQLADRLAAA